MKTEKTKGGNAGDRERKEQIEDDNKEEGLEKEKEKQVSATRSMGTEVCKQWVKGRTIFKRERKTGGGIKRKEGQGEESGE